MEISKPEELSEETKKELGLLDLKEIELELEWVNRPSKDGKRTGYWRRVPKTRSEPTPGQAIHRLRFSELGFHSFGERGVIMTDDGRFIPINAAAIGDVLRGKGLPRRELSPTERLWMILIKAYEEKRCINLSQTQ